MKHRTKLWECKDCDYTTTHASLAENHRNGQNHKLEMVYEQVEIGDGWEPEQDE
jgi:ribosomal protein L37AE/L43A